MEKINFEKPDIAALKKAGYACADLHIHSCYSDGLPQIKDIIKDAAKKKISIAITDHNAIEGSRIAAKQKKVFIIPGIEVNSIQWKDLLFYFYNAKEMEEFYDKNIRNNICRWTQRVTLTFSELIDLAKKYNCILSLAHPTGPLWKNTQEFVNKTGLLSCLNSIKVFEVMNGALTKKCNERSLAWARELNKGFSGGSDSHNLADIGRVVTCTPAESVEGFLENLVKKNSYIVGTCSNLLRKIIAGATITRGMVWNKYLKQLSFVKDFAIFKKYNKRSENCNN